MVKTNTKILGMIMIMLMAMQKTNCWYYYSQLYNCYHAYSCYRYASLTWMIIFNHFRMGWLRYAYAVHISQMLKMKNRLYDWNLNQVGSVLEPLIIFKDFEPYDGFKHREGHIYRVRRRSWRNLEQSGSPKFNEPVEKLKLPMLDDMRECESVEDCKRIMCEGVKNDFVIKKKYYDAIKIFYKYQMRLKWFVHKKELKNIKFFESSCFENPEETYTMEDTRFMREGDKVETDKMENMSNFLIFNTYDFSNLIKHRKFEGIEEMKEDGSSIDDHFDSSEENNVAQVVKSSGKGPDLGVIMIDPLTHKEENMDKVLDLVF